MFQADSGLGLVLPLAARPPRSVGFNNHLLFENLRISVKLLLHGFDFLKSQIPNKLVMANWPPTNIENKGVIPAFAGMTKMVLFLFFVVPNSNF